jgi:feruloyl esterase
MIMGAIGLMAAAGAAAQPAPPPVPSARLIDLPARAAIAPAMGCTDLMRQPARGAQGIAFRLRSAEEEAATGTRAAFCLVKGYVSPQTEFELRLPLTGYTGRFLQGGCGGMCGVIPNSILPQCSNAHAFGGAFAVAFNNGGHHGTGIGDGTWAVADPELRAQFADKATHGVALASKALVASFYGRPPEKSYFAGCSGGGREALMEAQRYPGDFDGIVAGSSVAMPAAMQLFLWEAQKGLDAEGREIFTDAAVHLLHTAVLESCDARDGIADGQIDDPRACSFDPAALRCRAGTSDPAACLSLAQVTAARAYYRGPTDAEGNALFPGGAPYGGELGWVGRGAPTQTGKFAAEAFLKYLLLPGELPPDFSWRDWRFSRASLARLIAAGVPYDSTDPDMHAFRDAGGKLLLWQGAADNAAGIYGMLDYYQAVRDHMGGLAATRDFARMFLVPGGYHCAGGYIAYDQDFLGAVVNWVELGKAPDAIEASATLADGLVRRRALYPYPTRTRYLGGDMNAAASFAPIAVRDAPEDGFDWPGSHAISKQRRNLAPRD